MTAQPTEPAPRTVLVLPGLRPDGVARMAGLLGTGGHLIPQPGCLLLVLDPGPAAGPAGSDEVDETNETDEADASDEIVARLSAALRKVQLMRVRLVAGYLAIDVWQSGAVTATPPAGVVAQQLPDPVLGLVHGSLDPATLPTARPVASRSGTGFFGRLLGR